MTRKVLYNVIKEYPEMIQIIIYKEPQTVYEGFKRSTKRSKPQDDYLTLERSTRRSKATIRDLVICNNFQLFCTFTFDPKKYDRYNFNNLKLVMLRWLNNQRREHSPALQYLVIPEFHKDGAIHFHALIKNYNGRVKETGKRTRKGNNVVYNLPSFRGGFTTASPINENIEAVAEYVSKYITKELITTFNKNRYFCSKGLIRPKKYNNKFVWIPKLNCKKQYDTKYYQSFLLKNNIDNRNQLMLD